MALADSTLQARPICFDIYIRHINIHGSSRGRGIVASAEQGLISTSRSVALYPAESEIYKSHIRLVNTKLCLLKYVLCAILSHVMIAIRLTF